MPDYVTIEMIEQRIGETRLARLSDFDPDHETPTRNDVYIEDTITRAERKVKTVLRERYKLVPDAAGAPEPVIEWVLALSIYYLFTGRPQYRALGYTWRDKAKEYEELAKAGKLGPDFVDEEGNPLMSERHITPEVRGPSPNICSIDDRKYF
jgi:hypothetical protein